MVWKRYRRQILRAQDVRVALLRSSGLLLGLGLGFREMSGLLFRSLDLLLLLEAVRVSVVVCHTLEGLSRSAPMQSLVFRDDPGTSTLSNSILNRGL